MGSKNRTRERSALITKGSIQLSGIGGNVICSPGSCNGTAQYVTAMLLDANRPLAGGVNYTSNDADFLFLRLQNDRMFGDKF